MENCASSCSSVTSERHVVGLERLDVLRQQLALLVVVDRRRAGASRSRSAASSVARARCSALLTDATDVSSSSATSVACQRSTSRRTSTARCLGGRCCSAATNARRSVSRCLGDLRRVGLLGQDPRRRRSAGPSCARAPRARRPRPRPGPRSIGCARRCAPPSMSKQTLLAIRYSHDFSAARSLQLVGRPPRAHHRLLHRVLGLRARAEQPVAVAGQRAAVGFQLLLDRRRGWSARGHPTSPPCCDGRAMRTGSVRSADR